MLLLLTALTLVALDSRRDSDGPIGSVGSLAHEVVGPVRRATSVAVSPISNWLDGVTSAGSLDERNDELRRELADARARLGRADDAIEENRRLATLLGLEYLEGIERINARVISPPTGNYEETVVVGVGTAAGIREGMPVVASEGLFGRVIEVSRTQAKILVLTDGRFSVAVRSTRDRLEGIASGRSSRRLMLDFVTATEGEPLVVRGDALTTSGRGGSRYPAGIPVGVIDEVFEDVSTSTRTALVDPFVAIDAVEVVSILDWDPVRDAVPEESS